MAEEGKKLKDKHGDEDFIVIGMFVLDALRDGIINKTEFAVYTKLCGLTYLKDGFYTISAGELGKGLKLKTTAVRDALWGLRDKGFIVRGESELGKSATWKVMRSSIKQKEAAIRRKGKKGVEPAREQSGEERSQKCQPYRKSDRVERLTLSEIRYTPYRKSGAFRKR